MPISRRGFLGGAAFALGAAPGADFPLVDYHCHLDAEVTLDKALAISRERGVKFGIVAHAGKRQYSYSGLISNDRELRAYLATLAGKPVFKGIQAEGVDWMECFSKDAVAELDYVLTDALTFPEKDGRLVRIWTPAAHVDDKQDWMERYTAFNVRVVERQPIDILANPTFLPEPIAGEYDALWTPARMRRIIDAAVTCRVAIEINSRYRLPGMAFLRMARDAGAKFSFGSNIHGLDVGRLDYCLTAARELGLTRRHMWAPQPPGRKPIQVRKIA